MFYFGVRNSGCLKLQCNFRRQYDTLISVSIFTLQCNDIFIQSCEIHFEFANKIIKFDNKNDKFKDKFKKGIQLTNLLFEFEKNPQYFI